MDQNLLPTAKNLQPAKFRITVLSLCLLSLLLLYTVVSPHASGYSSNTTSKSSSPQLTGTSAGLAATSTSLFSSSSRGYVKPQVEPNGAFMQWKNLPWQSNGVGITQKHVHATNSGKIMKDPRIHGKAGSSSLPAQSGPDGYCYYGPGQCSLDYQGGYVMHNPQIIIDVWAGQTYNSCNGQSIFEPGLGSSNGDCHYIFLQELFVQDFCADTGSGASLFYVMNQYTDPNVIGGGFNSCKLVGGGAQEYPGGYSVQYVYDSTPFPNDGNCGGAPTCITDANIQSSAENIANYEGCPQNGIGCYVAVLLPYYVCQDPSSNGGWCAYTGSFDGFCAYHNYAVFGSNVISYADMPVDYAGGCGVNGLGNPTPAPTGDAIGDTEVSAFSHEMSETLTDPLPQGVCSSFGSCDSGWVSNVNGGEIGDQCAYDYSGQTGGGLVGTESFDGSNVHMGPNYDVNGYLLWDPFEIQSEWDNTNGGCTLSLNGAPTLVQQTLTPDSAGTPTLGSAFLTTYLEAGSTNYDSYVYEPAGVNDIWITPSSSVVTYPYCDDGDFGASGTYGCEQVGYNFAYCFSLTCDAQQSGLDTFGAGQTLFLNYYYYLLYEEQPYMNVLDGGSPASVSVAWLMPPTCGSSCNGVADSYSSNSATLPIGTGGHYASLDTYPVYGTQMNVPSVDAGSTNQRWWTLASGADTFVTVNYLTPVALGFNYYQQYFVTFTYTCKGTTCPSGFSATPTSAWYFAGVLTKITASATGWAFKSWTPSGTVSLVAPTTANPNALNVTGTTGKIKINFIPGVALTMSPTSLSIAPGSTGSSTATIKGYPQSVTLSYTSSKTGITATFATNPITDSLSGVSDVVTIHVGSTVAAGTYTVTITAKGADGVTSSVKLTITVT
jgi:hypothetical protein